MKAFKKRVKLTQLNDDSKLGHSPLTGKRETVHAIQPPTGFGREIWEELVTLGALAKDNPGIMPADTDEWEVPETSPGDS